MRCDLGDCDYNACRNCVPEYIFEETELSERFSQEQNGKDLVKLVTTEKVGKGRKLHRFFIRPNEAHDRDHLTEITVNGDIACWRAGKSHVISLLNMRKILDEQEDNYPQWVEYEEIRIDLSDYIEKKL